MRKDEKGSPGPSQWQQLTKWGKNKQMPLASRDRRLRTEREICATRPTIVTRIGNKNFSANTGNGNSNPTFPVGEHEVVPRVFGQVFKGAEPYSRLQGYPAVPVRGESPGGACVLIIRSQHPHAFAIGNVCGVSENFLCHTPRRRILSQAGRGRDRRMKCEG